MGFFFRQNYWSKDAIVLIIIDAGQDTPGFWKNEFLIVQFDTYI